MNENFTILSTHSIFQFENLFTDLNNSGCIVTHFDKLKPFKKMSLSFEALRILNTPNAGGNSIVSEALSFEFFKKYTNAKLLKTEMEVEYFPEGGSINDYVMSIFGHVIGVSVTRAMKFMGNEFSIEDAEQLLSKKLKGIVRSTRNSLLKWEKQILHVWVMSEETANVLEIAWAFLDPALRTNTVLLITVAKNSLEIFMNPKKIVKKRNTI